MSIPFHAGIAGRQIEGAPVFGGHLFSLPDLVKWAAANEFHLHVPAIEGLIFVQAELLLCEIERQAMSEISALDAIALEQLNPPEPGDPYPDEPERAHWRHGAKAHLRWRRLLGKAIDAGELQLLDFASKLPIEKACAEPMTPALGVVVTVNADVESDSTPGNAPVGPFAPPPEGPDDRDDRRYRELRDAGGDYVNQFAKWKVTGPRGELAKLWKREKAAGRPMSDEKDVRESLKKAATRANNVKTAGLKGNSAFNP